MHLTSCLTHAIALYRSSHASLKEKTYSALAAGVAIFLLLLEVGQISSSSTLPILALASMGASTFLLFVVPHSPMAQPWPLLGGHLLAAFVGVACARGIADPAVATASAVALAVFGMHVMKSLHPPSAATAMIAVLGGPEIDAMGWAFAYQVVAINAASLLILAYTLNRLIPGRRYPMSHTHHPHHREFMQANHQIHPQLNEDDFDWALGRMDGILDVSKEDLIDLYEFAVEHAERRNGGVRAR